MAFGVSSPNTRRGEDLEGLFVVDSMLVLRGVVALILDRCGVDLLIRVGTNIVEYEGDCEAVNWCRERRMGRNG